MAGEIWKISDKVTSEEDIGMLAKVLITKECAIQYYGLGEKTLTKLAMESGSLFKIGSAVRIDRKRFEAFLRFIEEERQKKYSDVLKTQTGSENLT